MPDNGPVLAKRFIPIKKMKGKTTKPVRQSLPKHTRNNVLEQSQRQDCVVGTNLGRLNRCQRIASKVQIDLSARQVVYDDDFVTLIRQIETSGPTTKAVTSKNHDLLLGTRTIGAVGVGGEKSRLGRNHQRARKWSREGRHHRYQRSTVKEFHWFLLLCTVGRQVF